MTEILWRVFPNVMADRFYKKAKNTDSFIWRGNEHIYDDIEKNCELFLDKSQLKNKKKYIRDIIISYKKYGVTANEYFLFGFPQKKSSERNTYLSRDRKDALVIKACGVRWRNILGELKDKNVFYSFTKQFFNRKVCHVGSVNDFQPFVEFCCGLDSFIAKPSKGSCGRDIEIISLLGKDKKNVFDYLLSKGDYIVEELIVQDARIAEFNFSSVNTIRYPSFRNGEEITSTFPAFRCGKKNSIVDNAGSGGIFAAIDYDSGRIITDGFDELGNVYQCHPDSQKTFKGFQFPNWEELKELAKQVHASLPKEHKYVGFDFALSNKGWCLVEGNWGDFILQQTALERGFYKEFKQKIGL